MTTNTKFWTWPEIYTKIKSEMDLDEEDFIDEAEMKAYTNDAISEAEALIHTLNEDYFLTHLENITLESGIDAYNMPDDIYAVKIRKVLYYNGTTVYEIPRLKTLSKFIDYRLNRTFQESSNLNLCYFVTNITSSNPRIEFSPVPAAGGQFEIWYIRNANKLVDDEDVCDIPQFINFIFDYLRERICFKEAAGSPKHMDSKEKLDTTRQRMLNTLQDMAVDGEDEIEGDTSVYEEHN